MRGRNWSSRPRAVLLDVLLWALLSAPVGVALSYPVASAADIGRLLGSLLLLAVAVALSRRYPLISLVLVILPTAVDGNFSFSIPVLSYLVGLRMVRAGPAAAVFAVIACAGTAVTVGLLGSDLDTWFMLSATLLFAGVFPWLVGRYHRQHRALVAAGWQQADLLEREARGAGERIAMRERARIAQDMHDSLGHELSLIALRAGALEIATGLDDRHRQAAGELRASVGAATLRLREIIGVLRDDAEPAPTRPAGESVTDLVDRTRAAGMAIRLRADPPEQPGVHPVPAMVDRAVYRVVQEALTNATRYAPGAAVTVRLLRSAERTEVSVVNDRPPAGPLPGVPLTGSRPAGAAVGSGLVGLAEWVRQAGGVLRTGPRAGGFEVLAQLPHGAGALPADSDDRADQQQGSRSQRRMRDARQRVRRSLLIAIAAPVAIAGILSLVYYPFATFHTVLDSAAYDRMRVGEAHDELAGLLPSRQVRATSVAGRSVPGERCEFYTDGNFPFARASYRLCFAGGRLVAKDRV